MVSLGLSVAIKFPALTGAMGTTLGCANLFRARLKLLGRSIRAPTLLQLSPFPGGFGSAPLLNQIICARSIGSYLTKPTTGKR
jgi:hypothetical protein